MKLRQVNKLPLIVVVDTNFLAVPVQFGLDIFEEAGRVLERQLEFHIPDSVVFEMEKRWSNPRDNKERLAFNVARSLVQRCKIITIPEAWKKLSVDDQVLRYAKHVKGVLATNDKELRKKARFANIPVLFLRGRKKLEIDGTIF